MNYERFDHGNKKIYLVNMQRELHPYFSEFFHKALTYALQNNKKVWILINKKGYTNGIICHHCGNIPQCDRCSVAINYYLLPNGDKMGLCHICKKQYAFPNFCPQCWSTQIQEYGIGAQQLAQLLQEQYHADSLLIASETVRSCKKIQKLQEELITFLHQGNYPILIGTSLLTTPMKYYPLDLLIILDADRGLNLPDYNANEKNFYFLYEAFLKHQCPHFIVQTMNPNHYSIRTACSMKKSDFSSQEEKFRKAYGYPPFGELCVILYKDEIEEKLHTKVHQLYQELRYLQEKYQITELEMYTTPPLIYKIFGKYRYQVIIKGKHVRNFMDIVYSKLALHKKGFKINRDAESIV